MKSSEEAGKRAGGETSACEGRPCGGGGRVPGEWPRAAAAGKEGRGGETYSEEDGFAIN